ncbi:MAG: GNAT family N-acetyltransferase [Rickettsia endosymbiont of Ixodes persulcatus]|nr:GNAT family N-acetyltransferase [Rickettsia endosymbiont of Ixodes persulcatus]MCZ6914925.1 GNAT family N-acetyltransferase [Rickettsia endosymbiont of Ixodes persulcatus]
MGYSHIQLWSDERVATRIIVIDELKRNNNFGSKFLELCEKWLKSKGYKTLHIESSPAVLGFYRKNGYIEMPFNDPDGYESSPDDTAIGKIL